MEFKKIQHIKINKSKYDYLVLHLKGGNMGESIDKLAKKYPFKLKNDKLYITTKDPPPKMFSNQTGNLLVRSYNETYEFEVVYKENVMGVINEIYFDTLTGGFRGREGLYSVHWENYEIQSVSYLLPYHLPLVCYLLLKLFDRIVLY